jgi:hypothetical protein
MDSQAQRTQPPEPERGETPVANAAADAFLAGDIESLGKLLSADAEFHSPVTDYKGRQRIVAVLNAVAQVAGDLTRTSTLSGPGETALLFSGRLGEREARGVLHVTAAASGGVDSITLMIRPLSALLAGVEQMRRILEPAGSP